LQNRSSARHRLADTFHQRRFLRAGEEPLPHTLWRLIDSCPDIRQQILSILDLVDYRWRQDFIQ
jgi:hypothetical protein